MNKLLPVILGVIIMSGCVRETATIKGVEYVDSDPFENCVSCSYGVYKKENGEEFKLPTSDDKINQLVKGTKYNIEYETKSFDYPDNEVVNIFIAN